MIWISATSRSWPPTPRYESGGLLRVGRAPYRAVVIPAGHAHLAA